MIPDIYEKTDESDHPGDYRYLRKRPLYPATRVIPDTYDKTGEYGHTGDSSYLR